MSSQFQRIKSMLPVEITTAFVAIKTIFDEMRVGVGNLPAGQAENLGAMVFVMAILIIINVYFLRRSGESSIFLLAFSTVGFVIWSMNLDIIRWEDWFSTKLGFSPASIGAKEIVGVLAVLYALFALVLSEKKE